MVIGEQTNMLCYVIWASVAGQFLQSYNDVTTTSDQWLWMVCLDTE